MKKREIIAILISCHLFIHGFAQSNDEVENGLEKDRFSMNYKPIPFEPVRYADMFWQKRLIREIDVNEKLNLPFKFAQLPLFNLIRNSVCTGDLIVYDADTEMFSRQLYKEEACEMGEVTSTMEMINPISFEPEIKEITIPLSSASIVKYRLVEDWYFNEKTSTMKVMIVAIVPIREVYSSEGIFVGYSPLYWISYNSAREILANTKAFNFKNDERFLSWDDVLQERVFSSTIIYESNIFDRNIATYATGVNALLESNRIQEELFAQEHDGWTY